MKLTIKNFKAAIPKMQSKLLPVNFAQEAINVKVETGAIIPYRAPEFIENIPAPDYRYPAIYYECKDGKDRFFYSTSPYKVVKGPLHADQSNKVYMGLVGALWVADNNIMGTDQTIGGYDFIVAGIYNAEPVSINVVRMETPVLPTDIADPEYAKKKAAYDSYYNRPVDSRVYAAIWGRKWADGQIDIGPPHPTPCFVMYKENGRPGADQFPSLGYGDTPHTLAVRPSEAVSVGISPPNPTMAITRGINMCLIYRSTVSSSGEALFRLVTTFKVNPGNPSDTENPDVTSVDNGMYQFIDKVDSSNLGVELLSTDWLPPTGVLDVVSLSNGIIAGRNGYIVNSPQNSTSIIWSVPFIPHAWPSTYKVVLDSRIIGIGAFENSVVACTNDCPVLVTLQNPEQPVVRPIKDSYPCLNKESICSFGKGVLYATDTGIVLISQNAPQNITEPYFTKEQWLDLNPESLIGAVYNDKYYAFFTSPRSVMGFVLDLRNPKDGLTYLNYRVVSLIVAPKGQGLFGVFANDNRLYRIDNTVQDYEYFYWRSKTFVSPEGILTFSAARLDGDFESGDFTFNLYADGDLKYSRSVTSNKPFRIPSGFRHEQFEIELEGNTPLYDVQLATSMGELNYE